MWVCKLDAGFISLPFKGEAGDLKKKKKKRKNILGNAKANASPRKTRSLCAGADIKWSMGANMLFQMRSLLATFATKEE